MNRKLFNKHISKKCDVCRFGFLSEDKKSVLCKKHGIMQRDDKCHSFKYDATKREPEVLPELMKFSKDDFII